MNLSWRIKWNQRWWTDRLDCEPSELWTRGLVSLQTSDVDRGTWTRSTQSQEHRLSLWVLHSHPDPSLAQGLRRPFHAGPQLLLRQALRLSESWGSPTGESPDSSHSAAGGENTTSLPNFSSMHMKTFAVRLRSLRLFLCVIFFYYTNTFHRISIFQCFKGFCVRQKPIMKYLKLSFHFHVLWLVNNNVHQTVFSSIVHEKSFWEKFPGWMNPVMCIKPYGCRTHPSEKK